MTRYWFSWRVLQRQRHRCIHCIMTSWTTALRSHENAPNIEFSVKVQFRGPELFLEKGGTISRRTVPTSYLHASMNKLAIRLWMDGLNLNVILMFLPIWFCHTAAIASTWHPVQNLSTALPARGCHALQCVIGWELSCTCIVTSLSQRRRPKHGGLPDRWGSTCHAYGRKFAIKIQCEWDEKYVNLKMKT